MSETPLKIVNIKLDFVNGRSGKRATKKEYFKNYNKLKAVEDEFLKEINNEKAKQTYAMSYSFYNRLFYMTSLRLKSKYTFITKNYFEKMYKPIEKPVT